MSFLNLSISLQLHEGNQLRITSCGSTFKPTAGDTLEAFIGRQGDGTSLPAPAAIAVPGKTLPPARDEGAELVNKIVTKGWLAQEAAAALVQHCGLARVKDVANWINRKIVGGEAVAHPGSLLTTVSMQRQ